MTLAYTFALLSTMLGTALGLLGGHGRLAGGLRSFAFVAAVTVVFGQLLPEALAEAGLVVLLVFAAGVGLPRLFFRHHHHEGGDHGHGHSDDDDCETEAERLARKRAGLWLSLVAMMLHEAGDGLAIGTFASGSHTGHLHVEVFFAIAAHTVPVVALLVQAFVPAFGRTMAFFQGLALGLSGVLGVTLAGAVSASAAVTLTPYITAFAAGLLIHVVSHDHAPVAERSRAARFVDVLAVIAGVALVSQGGHAHGEYSGEVHGEVAESMSHVFLDLTLRLAPSLLLGLVLTALVQSLRKSPSLTIAAGEPAWRQGLRGALGGATLPVVGSMVLPASHELRSRGAGAALVMAFMLAAPQVGLDGSLVHGSFLGWKLSVVRVLGALVSAIGVGLLLGWLTKQTATPTEPVRDLEPSSEDSRLVRGLAQLDALFVHLLPHMILGLLAAVYVDVALARGALLGATRGSLDIVLATLVAIPLPLGVASATPLAAVLVDKGISSGAVLVGLLLAPTLSVTTLAFLRATFGARAALLTVVVMVAVSWALAFAVNAAGLDASVAGPDDHAHGVHAYVALGVLVLWVLRCVHQSGVSALVHGLQPHAGTAHAHAGHGHGGGDHEHHDDHGDHHDHGHGDHHDHGHGDHGHGGHGHGADGQSHHDHGH